MGPSISEPSTHDMMASFALPAETRPIAPQLPVNFDRATSDLLSEQTRLSILYCNPSPRRRSPGAIEKSYYWAMAHCGSAGICRLQSFSKTKTSPVSLIHVAHFLGCAAPFNKRTFVPDLDVKSIDVPAAKAYCGGWAFEAVLSKARCRRFPRTASRVSQSCRCAVTTRCL